MPTLLALHRGQPRSLAYLLAALLGLCASLAQAAQNLRELDEPALRAVHAQGLAELPPPSRDQDRELPEPSLPLRLFNPLFAHLDAEVQTRGLPATRTLLHADGTLELQVVGAIEEIRLDNLRVRGAPLEQRFGSLRFEEVNFAGSSLRIRRLP